MDMVLVARYMVYRVSGVRPYCVDIVYSSTSAITI